MADEYWKHFFDEWNEAVEKAKQRGRDLGAQWYDVFVYPSPGITVYRHMPDCTIEEMYIQFCGAESEWMPSKHGHNVMTKL